IATDLTGHIVRMNPAAESLTGWPFCDARNRHLREVLALRDKLTNEPVDDLVTRVVREGKVEGPSSHRLSVSNGGEERSIADTVAPIRDSTGRITGCVVVLRDTTEICKMESRLVFAERMASVGTLAAGVAHEINNPLAYVLANVDFAMVELQSALAGSRANKLEEIVEALQEARHGADRVRRIVRDLKTFSRAEADKREIVDVGPIIESSINMAWNEIRHRARLVKELSSVAPVDADPSRLGQVILNLLVNAAQAIPLGRADLNEIRVATRSDALGRVVIEVSDSGCGIPQHVLSRIFDPFFTTKPIGEGTGLGLAICQGIVGGLGGEITVDTAEGKGTTFRIALPAARQNVIPSAVSEPAAKLSRCTTRLLVLDDEVMIGKAMRRALGGSFEVTVLDCPKTALARIIGGERFDVIVCDLMMPVMTGMEFHAALSSFDPDLARRTIFATGGAFTAAAQAFLEREGILRADKPINIKMLRASISSLLGETDVVLAPVGVGH
ncbi:MAG: PAS domain-containing protein, partial [Deltaproteobacteria bacterium]|nr:PAS domain-containing protein [Deltaproteobacteria bacterium]